LSSIFNAVEYFGLFATQLSDAYAVLVGIKPPLALPPIKTRPLLPPFSFFILHLWYLIPKPNSPDAGRNLKMATHITPETNLGLYQRELLKAQFRADVAAGTARPLVLPLDLVGTFILPVVYLCIPHTRRPWLYRMRFAVMALMMWLNFDMISRAASTNIAFAYASGLAGVWGTLWGMTVLVWTRPQFEAERVQRRRKQGMDEGNGTLVEQNGHTSGKPATRHANVVSPGASHTTDDIQPQASAPDETVANALSTGYEYYWQSYPSSSPLPTRLDWVLDHVTSFRGSGWTTAIPSIPSFRRPDKPLSNSLVDLSSIPLATKTGYSRQPTTRSFLRSRLGHMALGYFILDICTVAMLNDPYFILGPDYSRPLPSPLSSLPPPILSILRSLTALSSIISALYLLFSCLQLLHLYYATYLSPPSARADLWHYPSVFGSFPPNVLDYGLAGFWGGWWHQTFRGAFVAPADWLARKGFLPRDRRHPVARTVGVAIAFAQSGLLHAGGSWSALGQNARPWSPPMFFAGSLVGVLVQAGWDAVMGRVVREWCPRWVRRGANLVFVLVWLHFTSWAFLDDLARAGIWLYEPLPVSVVRLMGWGEPGDGWWRWDWDVLPGLWVGKRWWESGIRL
jgi:hypothetical protein